MQKTPFIIFSSLFFVSSVFSNPLIQVDSQLNYVIDPEIKYDSFYFKIYEFALTKNIKTILEIGSSSGNGSTEAFAKGIKDNLNHPTLFCMEVSLPRFEKLQSYYQDNPQVKCFNVSSVPIKDFPSEQEVLNFIRNVPSKLSYIQENEVLRWLKQDIDYIKQNASYENGIDLIKSSYGIDDFDMVLIDGSEFTGMAELNKVYGARYILLDDIDCFKNMNNFIRLKKDPNYKLITENHQLRNGYAIFEKI